METENHFNRWLKRRRCQLDSPHLLANCLAVPADVKETFTLHELTRHYAAEKWRETAVHPYPSPSAAHQRRQIASHHWLRVEVFSITLS